MPVDRKTTNRGILTKNFRRLTDRLYRIHREPPDRWIDLRRSRKSHRRDADRHCPARQTVGRESHPANGDHTADRQAYRPECIGTMISERAEWGLTAARCTLVNSH